jgi:hypothetical protein
VQWDWESETMPFCLKPSNPASELKKLSDSEFEIGQMMVKEWKKWQS